MLEMTKLDGAPGSSADREHNNALLNLTKNYKEFFYHPASTERSLSTLHLCILAKHLLGKTCRIITLIIMLFVKRKVVCVQQCKFFEIKHICLLVLQ